MPRLYGLSADLLSDLARRRLLVTGHCRCSLVEAGTLRENLHITGSRRTSAGKCGGASDRTGLTEAGCSSVLSPFSRRDRGRWWPTVKFFENRAILVAIGSG